MNVIAHGWAGEGGVRFVLLCLHCFDFLKELLSCEMAEFSLGIITYYNEGNGSCSPAMLAIFFPQKGPRCLVY